MKTINKTIPLYFDQSLSYLELVGNLYSQFEDVLEKSEEVLEAVHYDKEENKTIVNGDLEVDGKIVGDIEIGEGTTLKADIDGNATSATKLGLVDVGSNTKPIYLDEGVPKEANGVLVNDISGNANTATKLKTPRNIQLVGNVTGVANFDGSGDVTITTEITGITPDNITLINNDLTINGDLTMGTNKNVVTSGTGKFVGTLEGNVLGNVSGTSQSASRLNNMNVGDEAKPVYFLNGIPVACENTLDVDIVGVAESANTLGTSTIGSSSQPIYLVQGEPVAITGALGNDITGNANTATTATKLGTTNVGGAYKPIYLNGGVATACDDKIRPISYGYDDPDASLMVDGEVYIKLKASV